MMTLIRINNISAAYRVSPLRRHTVLKNVSFELPAGRIHGLLGENGAGKTTLIKTILGLMHHERGSIEYFRAGEKVNRTKWLEVVGYVPEQNVTVNLTGEQFLRAMHRFYRHRADQQEKDLDYVMETTGLNEVRNVNIRHYSKGMKKRLLLAQSLLNRPEILILDEPMTGLDPLQRYSFRQLLEQLRTSGSTVLISSHELAVIEQVCQEASLLKDGEILSTIKLNELALAGNLEGLYLKYYQS